MKVITPLDLEPRSSKTDVALFLAGGISNCGDWQTELIKLIDDRFGNPDDLTIYNPRRANYHDSDEVAREQITWERAHLWRSHIILFWFPAETLCPITLFEYGYWLATLEQLARPRIVVGCHPNYQRKFDLEVQTELTHGSILIRNDWNLLLADLNEQYSYARLCIASSAY